MQTLKQYLEMARKDYTYANMRVYRPEPDNSVSCVKQVAGDINFVLNYFKKDPWGNHLIFAGHFNPGGSRVRGNFFTCVCTYRMCDSH